MYKFIDNSDNVIALRLTNTITGDDLNAIMDRVDDMMATQSHSVHPYSRNGSGWTGQAVGTGAAALASLGVKPPLAVPSQSLSVPSV